MRRVLRAGGVFALSCEALPDDGAGAAAGYALQPSNRFAHALAYVTGTAQAAGFAVVATQQAVLRRDHGRDVSGYLVVLG
jgi:predicted TPR repeat methyltransferase